MSKELAQSKSSKCVDSLKAFFVDDLIPALPCSIDLTRRNNAAIAEEIAFGGPAMGRDLDGGFAG